MTVWTEWDPLKEVIVGNCYAECNPQWALDPIAKKLFGQILAETKEDLDNLSNYLTKLGVKVRRPTVTNFNQTIPLGNFNVLNATAPIVPRDQYMVYGNTVYQTYTSMPDRYLDSLNYYDIFNDMFKEGYNWISQPPPILENFADNLKWWNDGDRIYHQLHKDNVLWHTATMFKCGDALITNNLGPGSQLGLDWMQRNTDAKIINNNNTVVDNWGHIDHGFFMTDDNTVFCINKEWVPEVLRNKNIIEMEGLFEKFAFQDFFKDYKSHDGKLTVDWLERWLNEWKGYAQEVAFDTNVLVVDSKNIIFSNKQPKLFNLFESMGITCHVCEMRHGIFWESGVHCLTLDIKRQGERRNICG